MLKKIKKNVRQRRLQQASLFAAILGSSLAWGAAMPCAFAATLTTPQTFTSGNHILYDSIKLSADGIALTADGTSTSISMSGLSLSASGNSNLAAYTKNGAAIYLTDMTLQGNNWARGVYSYGSASRIIMTGGSIAAFVGAEVNQGSATLTDVAITTNNGTGPGLLAAYGGSIVMTGGSITGYNGIDARYSGSQIILTNTPISVSDTAIWAFNDATISASVHGQNIWGTRCLMNANNATINLAAYNGSALYGRATLLSAGTINLTLNSGSTWTIPDDSTLTTLTLNDSSVRFTTPTSNAALASYKSLTVNNSLSGNGAFYFNSNLVKSYADTLKLASGSTLSGSYQLYVRNWGGTPDDLRKTVKLINLSGTGNAVFSGGSDVGVYRYGIAQGTALYGSYSGIANAGDGNYYLYNTFTPSTPVRVAAADSMTTNVMGYGEMNEIKKRMGELRMGTQTGDDIWVRTYAEKFHVHPRGSESFTSSVNGIEFGKDNPSSFSTGKKYTGFLIGYGQSSNDFTNDSSGNVSSAYLGSYVSWLRNDGVYLDLIGKYNFFHHTLEVPLMGGGNDSSNYRNRGLSLSAEIGKRFQRGNGYFIEPAAEVTGLWSNDAAYVTANDISISLPSQQSLLLRLGCTAGRKWQGADQVNRELYVKTSWINEYDGDSTVRADAISFDSSVKGHQWATGIGYVEDSEKGQIYMDAEKSWGHTTSKEWGFNVGYRWKF